MASKTQTRPEPFLPMEAWPPDDTEESVVGLSIHQTTIRIVTEGINAAAYDRRRTGEPLPWDELMHQPTYQAALERLP